MNLALFPHTTPCAVRSAQYTAAVAGGRDIERSPDLVMVLMAARAAALRGYRVWIRDHEQHTVGVRHDGEAFVVDGDTPWSDRAQRILTRHGGDA